MTPSPSAKARCHDVSSPSCMALLMALTKISDRTCECEVDEFPTYIEVAFSEYLW